MPWSRSLATRRFMRVGGAVILFAGAALCVGGAAVADPAAAASGGGSGAKAPAGNGSGAAKSDSKSTPAPPLVAGEGLSVSDLHIGFRCDVVGGEAKIKTDISTRQVQWGAHTDVVVYYDPNFLSNVKIEETERQTRLWSDVQAALSGVAEDSSNACDKVKVTKTLVFKRATVKITGVDLKGADAKSVTVISGPVEHGYLGLDLPVTNRKTLKYDAASQSLQPASDSPQLYLSLNFLVGDVLSPAAGFDSDFYKNFSVKFFVSASSKPLNSLGVGLGYRLPELKVASFDLSALSLYGGYFWTKEDSTSSTGEVQVNGGTNRGFRFGITYDVSSAIRWVKW